MRDRIACIVDRDMAPPLRVELVEHEDVCVDLHRSSGGFRPKGCLAYSVVDVQLQMLTLSGLSPPSPLLPGSVSFATIDRLLQPTGQARLEHSSHKQGLQPEPFGDDLNGLGWGWLQRSSRIDENSKAPQAGQHLPE